MRNQVISETLLGRREEWQNNTIVEMQKKLNSHPAGRYIVADYKKSLVVIYGNSQIGKTSLILHMMGIKEEHQREVYRVLRAKQEYGDSSTSTAIMYLISPSDYYGICFSDDEEEEIEFCDSEDMIRHLSDIRNEVESGYKDERILYVFIPRRFFSENTLEQENYSILDLPGINSKNENEKEHVASVVDRYMSLATVKIVVTKGDSIQDLDSIEVPEGVDWKSFPNKYFIVITMAYSQGSVKNYFEIKKTERHNTFLEHILNSYCEIPNIIGTNEIEWYPIDVGESYQNLLNMYKEDSSEIIDAQSYFTKQICDAIAKRRGNGLRNIIEDLKTYSKDYYRVKIMNLNKDINELKEEITIKKTDWNSVIGEKKKYEDIISGYTIEEISKFSDSERIDLNHIRELLNQEAESFIRNISEIFPDKIKDHELKIMQAYLAFSNKDELVTDKIKSILGEDSFEKAYSKGISLEKWDEVNDLLTQQKLELTKMFRPKGLKYLVSKVSRSDAIGVLQRMTSDWIDVVSKKIDEDLEPIILDINDKKSKYFEVNQLYDYKKSQEAKLSKDITLLTEKLKKCQNERARWGRKEKTDKKLIETYISVAQKEYDKCKKSILTEMQDKDLYSKLQYLILLGLMERDFNSTVKGA